MKQTRTVDCREKRGGIIEQLPPPQQDEQQATPATGVETPLDGRAALAAARREDRAWRTRREVRVKEILQRIESVTEWGMGGLWLVMIALFVVGEGCLLVGFGITLVTGGPVPEWLVAPYFLGYGGLIVGGLLAVGGFFVGWSLYMGRRKWAAWQAIDLSDESEAEVQSGRMGRHTG